MNQLTRNGYWNNRFVVLRTNRVSEAPQFVVADRREVEAYFSPPSAVLETDNPEGAWVCWRDSLDNDFATTLVVFHWEPKFGLYVEMDCTWYEAWADLMPERYDARVVEVTRDGEAQTFLSNTRQRCQTCLLANALRWSNGVASLAEVASVVQEMRDMFEFGPAGVDELAASSSLVRQMVDDIGAEEPHPAG